MKSVGQLKEDILDNKIDKFYVFYGEDYGIRKHYINKISTFFTSKPLITFDYNTIKVSNKTQTLFGSDETLVVVYNDLDFANLKAEDIQKFIDGLEDYTCIFVYEEPLEKSVLFKDFDQYITNFSLVRDNIGLEFVKGEVDLIGSDVDRLAHNCNNNYNNIVLECDKIKSYANAKQMSQQSAYEVLDTKNQLLERIDDYNVNLFMNDILQYNFNNFAYWYEILSNNLDKFFASLTLIFNDFMIAALLKMYGRDGSSIAYDSKFNWGRIKVIRNFNIPYTANQLFECGYKIADLDSNIKLGRVNKEQMVDRFFNQIL